MNNNERACFKLSDVFLDYMEKVYGDKELTNEEFEEAIKGFRLWRERQKWWKRIYRACPNARRQW